MNHIVLIGRPTKDVELKFTPGTGTAVATLTLAVDRKFVKDGKKEADFIPVVIWGKQAENTANYVSKGKLIAIAGRIQTRSYDNKEGKKVFITEVVAEEVKFLERGDKGKAATSEGSFNFDNDVTPVDDGDIPF